MTLLRKRVNRSLLRQRLPRQCLTLIMCLTWPIRLLYLCIKLNNKFHKDATQLGAKKREVQLLEIVFISAVYGIPPKAYYSYQLFKKENRAKAQSYFFDHEIPLIFPLLNKNTTHREVQDKLLFSKYCQKHKLPHARIISEITVDATIPTQTELPQSDLFIKPRTGSKGQDCMLWKFSEGTYFNRNIGKKLTKQELLQFYNTKKGQGSFIVQKKLSNHSELQNISSNALCSIRVITLKSNNGAIQLLSAVFKMPASTEDTDNIGVYSPIDAETGKLGNVFNYKVFCEQQEYHPYTHSKITGRLLPYWYESMQLALNAHEHFPKYFSLGWDIAITNNGPILLEANTGWDVFTMQRAFNMPLGNTIFKQLAMQKLNRFTN